MVLLEPNRTQFDLQWRMFGVSIRVHPMFWLVSAILGFDIQREKEFGFPYLLLWIALVFVSILVHEFGHVFAGQLFGARGHIVLFSFGGLAIGSSNLPGRWQRIFVFVAGPLAQLLLYGAIRGGLYLLARHGDPELAERILTKPVTFTLAMLIFINLYWALLNLVPIWPLDGGKIANEIFEMFAPGRGLRLALGVSLVIAGFFAVNALVAMNRGKPLVPYLPTGGWYTVLLFGFLAFSNFQSLQQIQQGPWGSEGRPWERDDDWRR